MPQTAPLLSQQLADVADDLRHVRAQLVALCAVGQLPEGAFPSVSVVMTQGLEVIHALENLTRRLP